MVHDIDNHTIDHYLGSPLAANPKVHYPCHMDDWVNCAPLVGGSVDEACLIMVNKMRNDGDYKRNEQWQMAANTSS